MFLRDIVSIKEEEDAVCIYKKKALFNLPVSEFMTRNKIDLVDNGLITKEKEIQIRKEAREKVSKRFNSYIGY